MWKKVLREYFAFPRKERKGLAVLFIVWFIVLLYSAFSKHFLENFRNKFDYKLIVSEEIKFRDAKQFDSISNSYHFSKRFYPKYFNYVEEQDLLNIGLKADVVKTILEAKDSGIKIFSISDLNKLKIDSSSKNILKEKLKFFPEKKYFSKEFFKVEKIELFDLNNADTNAIDKLKGISKSLAKRIVNYRDKLGGFIHKEQLKEVWGMDSASYEILQNSTHLNSSIKKININTTDVKALGMHPYIGFPMAKLIVNYRLQHGNYIKIEDLFQIHVMNADIFSKIEAYITTVDD